MKLFDKWHIMIYLYQTFSSLSPNTTQSKVFSNNLLFTWYCLVNMQSDGKLAVLNKMKTSQN